ncbi:MAG: hypothetical protein M1825_002229 [Sarcosagium campestre]|nr:MAG: hypothetical protein M1825_002229 [Sarcosagium campestre]
MSRDSSPGLSIPRESQSDTDHAPRILIIGAGSRGNAYARAITDSTDAVVVSVAEPIISKRDVFGKKYIWKDKDPEEGQDFSAWQDWIAWERQRRKEEDGGGVVLPGVDAVFVCTLDEMHAEIITALAPFNLHIMSEKPLATTLQDCLNIYKSLIPEVGSKRPERIFAIGHVLRYSPHNMLLRDIIKKNVVGEIYSIEHTEPVGWWHFAHSYVRGNWRYESKTGPSLLTKSCHDIDLLLWLLCPPPRPGQSAHLPSTVMSTGSLAHFKASRKPAAAGRATNCLSCPAEAACKYSAKKVYGRKLEQGKTGWPVKIVLPEVEDCLRDLGAEGTKAKLLERLGDDYGPDTPLEEVQARPWFGRCVFDAGNDVCDDQTVIMTWNDESDLEGQRAEDDGEHVSSQDPKEADAWDAQRRCAKTATFHMVAFTEKICERRTRIYGSKGEIVADSKTISVHDFDTSHTTTHHPPLPGGGHGGGDDGLARQFILAVDAVKNRGVSAEEAQRMHVGCTLEDIIRSHAMVFAADDARKTKRSVDWPDWWQRRVQDQLDGG